MRLRTLTAAGPAGMEPQLQVNVNHGGCSIETACVAQGSSTLHHRRGNPLPASSSGPLPEPQPHWPLAPASGPQWPPTCCTRALLSWVALDPPEAVLAWLTLATLAASALGSVPDPDDVASAICMASGQESSGARAPQHSVGCPPNQCTQSCTLSHAAWGAHPPSAVTCPTRALLSWLTLDPPARRWKMDSTPTLGKRRGSKSNLGPRTNFVISNQLRSGVSGGTPKEARNAGPAHTREPGACCTGLVVSDVLEARFLSRGLKMTYLVRHLTG